MSEGSAIKEFLQPHPYLRKAREAAGLSQEELASLTGISRGTLGLIERVDAPCKPEFRARIAYVLRKNITDLWPLDLYPPPEPSPYAPPDTDDSGEKGTV